MDKQIENLLDKIVDAEGGGVIKAYEKRINKLEYEKLVLQERMENTVKKRCSPEEMFELTLKFLENPVALWKGRLEYKRTVLKLTFSEQLAYCRKEGFRTPNFSNIFRLTQDLVPLRSQMAERQGFEPWKDLHPCRFSRPVHSTTLPSLHPKTQNRAIREITRL